MYDPTLHLRAEMLIALKRQGMPADLLLRMVVHLKHLCPVCAVEIERFANLKSVDEILWLESHSIPHGASDRSVQRLERQADELARRLATLPTGDRPAALAVGAIRASPALFNAWLRHTRTELGADSGNGESNARFALRLAQYLDPETVPIHQLIDFQVEAWSALTDDALRRAHIGQATLALRTAGLLAEGGSGDPKQATWLRALRNGLARADRSRADGLTHDA